MENTELFIGMTIEDANQQKHFKIILVAILRNEQLLSNPDLSEKFQRGDTLIFIGNPKKSSISVPIK
ncbi:TrkA C-terminal domain-containing protein [Lederbergia citrisecunda]|uniref:cation:proton antiporter regulatory subunit n=1 Tax=Lederbergia citrisecunda TaxID=2833583 RepID=UPI003D28EB47